MAQPLPSDETSGLLEYSVVFSDRAINHMSQGFQAVMREIDATLKRVYGARSVVVVPGGGTYAMEAVARQFATGEKVLVLRNGFFSFRWSQILEMGAIAREETVLKARPASNEPHAPFAPAPIEEVVRVIAAERPSVVFVPHVETASGIILPDDYLKQVGDAVRAAGGLFVLDCIASGAVWVDMRTVGADVLISAPQKGWSGPACAGLVMLSERAKERLSQTKSTSFSLDLAKWAGIMDAYTGGGHAYHATMPTDALTAFRDAMRETEAFGFEEARNAQLELGRRVRELLAGRGFPSVAAAGFEAPGVVVSFTDDPGIKSGAKFAQAGLQIAGGVPLKCDEPDSFSTFRLGLFGLDKLQNIDRAVDALARAIDAVK